MPAPTPGDFKTRITGILQSVQLLPDEAEAPIRHYRQTVGEIDGALKYVDRIIPEKARYQGVVIRHLGRLSEMALVNFIETFERFLKEVAAKCVDCLADLVVDDRFDVFSRIQGSNFASHFGAGTLGKALCESATWLDCEEINKRFHSILADPFDTGAFFLFPKKGQKPDAGQWRYSVMKLVWQMRHTCVHNVGVITQSDAVKMRVLAKRPVDAPRMLVPSRSDLRWLKRFLDDTAEDCNKRIGQRLAELLTKIRAETPALVEPQQMADRLSSIFRLPLQVDTALGVVPPPD
jgi:hypothetical protein